MEKRGGAAEAENGDAFLELSRVPAKYPHRYTKVGSLPAHRAAGRRGRGGGGGLRRGGSGFASEGSAWVGTCGTVCEEQLVNATEPRGPLLAALLIPTA